MRKKEEPERQRLVKTRLVTVRLMSAGEGREGGREREREKEGEREREEWMRRMDRIIF